MTVIVASPIQVPGIATDVGTVTRHALSGVAPLLVTAASLQRIFPILLMKLGAVNDS